MLKEKLHKETRVKIIADKEELIDEAFNEILVQRKHIESYIKENPQFLTALAPIKIKETAPKIVKDMGEAGKIADVGPMAAVAGVLAECGVKKIMHSSKIAVVENGGDIFISTKHPITIGIFSSSEKLKDKLAFRITENLSPISICSSSSYLGHSLSFGECDLATVFSKSGSIADACVTSLCNSIKKDEDIQPALNNIMKCDGVLGAIAIKNDKIGMIGKIPELVKLEDKKLKEKITKDPVYRL